MEVIELVAGLGQHGEPRLSRSTSDVAAAEARRRASEESYRSSSWIPTEILLEHLGHPLDPGEVQWMEPYADVNSRWLAIFGQIVDRARPIAPNY